MLSRYTQSETFIPQEQVKTIQAASRSHCGATVWLYSSVSPNFTTSQARDASCRRRDVTVACGMKKTPQTVSTSAAQEGLFNQPCMCCIGAKRRNHIRPVWSNPQVVTKAKRPVWSKEKGIMVQNNKYDQVTHTHWTQVNVYTCKAIARWLLLLSAGNTEYLRIITE